MLNKKSRKAKRGQPAGSSPSRSRPVTAPPSERTRWPPGLLRPEKSRNWNENAYHSYNVIPLSKLKFA
jgi:hypothetical protein